MNEEDFSAPKLRDTDPPPMYATVRASQVSYNSDLVEYLINEEAQRRVQTNKPQLTAQEVDQFRKELVSLLVIYNNPEAAINLRPASTTR